MADTLLSSVDLLADHLPLLAKGKVRELYTLDEDSLLFVATDRISAYDVVMANGIPQKGQLLTLLSAHWMSVLTKSNPDLRTHLVSLALPSSIPASLHPQLRHRCMQVRKLRVLPIEAIVRGYITGSAWKEYRAQGTVHGIRVRPGMRESEAFESPLYTPSTKAEAGEKDENIHPDRALEIVGAEHGRKIEELALKLYKTARDYALERGIIVADTKFEFGLDSTTNEVALVDEVLTPVTRIPRYKDSSRFWPASKYEPGHAQESFDKQFVRDWLVGMDLQGKEGVELPETVVARTAEKYREAFERLTGKNWVEALREEPDGRLSGN
ncbi:MAG: Bifunctional purine biosynthetic protein ade1 [Peltula sp. TS41687]|nr:MAG: Bifunctional purine biosynthetic protein ade1 [Peltula sp. TS41687]